MILLTTPAGNTVIRRVPGNFAPGLVGAARRIRFLPLPLPLQPYLAQGEVLFVTAVRSTGGDGQGQCGAGVEVHLNAASVRAGAVAPLPPVLIESCLKNAELQGDDPDKLSAFSVVGGRLRLAFLSYGEHQEDDIAARLSTGLDRLEFEVPAAK